MGPKAFLAVSPVPPLLPKLNNMKKERTLDEQASASKAGRKQRPGVARSRREEPLQPKGRVSRNRILKAAVTVFSRQPYSAASLRAIGKEGGFDPPLIHYYFPTKADLFDEVAGIVFSRMYETQLTWYGGLDFSKPEASMKIVLNRIFDHFQENPEMYRILFINMAVIDGTEFLPGMDRIPGILDASTQLLLERVPFAGSAEEIGFLIHNFMNHLLLYLGSAPCKGLVLGMDPMGPDYRKWVIRSMTFLFLPLIEKHLAPAQK